MSEENRSRPPSREELAGVYVYIEAEEKVTLPPPDKVKPAAPEDLKKLTREERAGITVHIEGEEKINPPAPSTAAEQPMTPDLSAQNRRIEEARARLELLPLAKAPTE